MSRGRSCLSDLILDEKLGGANLTPEAAAHLSSCRLCAARQAVLLSERTDFLARARPEAFADAVMARAPSSRRRAWLYGLALAPAAIGAVAVVALWMRPRPFDGERVKGAPVAVELYVRSGDKTERYAADHRYRGGDTLQLVYSSTAPRHLTVVDVEAGGKTAVLYRSEGPLPAAKRRRLEQSWVLDGGTLHERLYLVFTDGAPDATALLLAARRADVDRTVELDVPAAAQSSFLIAR